MKVENNNFNVYVIIEFINKNHLNEHKDIKYKISR